MCDSMYVSVCVLVRADVCVCVCMCVYVCVCVWHRTEKQLMYTLPHTSRMQKENRLIFRLQIPCSTMCNGSCRCVGVCSL